MACGFSNRADFGGRRAAPCAARLAPIPRTPGHDGDAQQPAAARSGAGGAAGDHKKTRRRSCLTFCRAACFALSCAFFCLSFLGGIVFGVRALDACDLSASAWPPPRGERRKTPGRRESCRRNHTLLLFCRAVSRSFSNHHHVVAASLDAQGARAAARGRRERAAGAVEKKLQPRGLGAGRQHARAARAETRGGREGDDGQRWPTKPKHPPPPLLPPPPFQEPIIVWSFIIGGIGLALPVVVPPLRDATTPGTRAAPPPVRELVARAGGSQQQQ